MPNKHPSRSRFRRENERELDRRYYEKHKDKIKKKQRAYYKKNKVRLLQWQAAYYKANKKKRRHYMVEHRFGLTKIEYEALKKKQKNLCAICSRRQVRGWRNLAVDHDHRTGKVRGLLCNNCNRAMGLFKDDPKLLKKALHYLGDRA